MLHDEAIVTTYLDALAASPKASDSDLRERLLGAGYDQPLVAQAIQFIPLAFGRTLLGDMGIQFSSSYFLMSGEGELVDTGQLETLVVYATARSLASTRNDVMSEVALRSPEIDAINQALHAGSKPADLVTAPVIAFVETATEKGLAAAAELLRAEAAGVPSSVTRRARAAPNPWWKFW